MVDARVSSMCIGMRNRFKKKFNLVFFLQIHWDRNPEVRSPTIIVPWTAHPSLDVFIMTMEVDISPPRTMSAIRRLHPACTCKGVATRLRMILRSVICGVVEQHRLIMVVRLKTARLIMPPCTC